MDPVEEQVVAYNARDLERFIACYSPQVVIEDAQGKPLMEGHEEMRSKYGPSFAAKQVQARILNRIRVGSTVVDEELVRGLNPDGSDVRAIVVYNIAGEKIARVRFLADESVARS